MLWIVVVDWDGIVDIACCFSDNEELVLNRTLHSFTQRFLVYNHQ